MKKWFVMMILMILILSNSYLIYQNASLLREHKKLLLFQTSKQQERNEVKEKTAETLVYMLSMKDSVLSSFQNLSIRENGLSLTMDVEDIEALEKIEHTLSEYLQERPRIEALRTENSIHVVLNYGGVR